jgi:hypothetical protein
VRTSLPRAQGFGASTTVCTLRTYPSGTHTSKAQWPHGWVVSSYPHSIGMPFIEHTLPHDPRWTLHQDRVMGRAPHRCDLGSIHGDRRHRARVRASRRHSPEAPRETWDRSAAPPEGRRPCPHDCGHDRHEGTLHPRPFSAHRAPMCKALMGRPPHRRASSGFAGRQAAVKACEPSSVRYSLQNTMEPGLALADLSRTGSLLRAASFRACMWLDGRSRGWSMARLRAEVSTGQTDLSGAKTAPCPEWSTSRVLRASY